MDEQTCEAEVFMCDKSIRSFQLAESGSHKRIIFPEDIEPIEKRHIHDRDRIDRMRSRKRAVKSGIEVDIRHPSFYDSVVEMEAQI